MSDIISLDSIFMYEEKFPVWLTVIVIPPKNISVDITEEDLEVGNLRIPYTVNFEVTVGVSFAKTMDEAEEAAKKAMGEQSKDCCYHTIRLKDYLSNLRSTLEVEKLIDKYLPAE